MAKSTTVGIKELKNNLSAYLREVRKGTRVFVSDRGKVVAEIREPGAVYATEDEPNPVLAAWVREGIVTLPTRAKTPTPKSPVKLPDGTAARIVNENRRDRGR